jgi:1,6-anhydro-N-acetylmuramate kinase
MYDFLLAYLEAQQHANRSLGSGDDLCEIVIEKGSTLTTADLAASAAAAIGRCITNSLGSADRVLLAGGGVNNVALCQSIRSDGTTEDFGVPTQAREAMGMAILGALAQDDISITLPQITGRQETSELVGWVQASP